MIYIPEIVDYKPFYIQAEGDRVAKDTTVWGLVAKSNPYPILPNPKDPFKNEWNDENGDDEWCEEMHYEASEITVKFYIKAHDYGEFNSAQTIHNQMEAFFSYIQNGTFRIYDSYTGIGRGNVRYAGYEEESFIRRGTWSRAIFEVKFKINDPVTRYVFENGEIKQKV